MLCFKCRTFLKVVIQSLGLQSAGIGKCCATFRGGVQWEVLESIRCAFRETLPSLPSICPSRLLSLPAPVSGLIICTHFVFLFYDSIFFFLFGDQISYQLYQFLSLLFIWMWIFLGQVIFSSHTFYACYFLCRTVHNRHNPKP